MDAHHAIVRVAANTYGTPTFKDADIVVTNAYPQNAQAYHAQRWINLSVKDGGIGMLIIQHPLTMINYSAGTHFATKWEEVIQVLRERHKGDSVRVAVYPYGGIQHQEIELDG